MLTVDCLDSVDLPALHEQDDSLPFASALVHMNTLVDNGHAAAYDNLKTADPSWFMAVHAHLDGFTHIDKLQRGIVATHWKRISKMFWKDTTLQKFSRYARVYLELEKYLIAKHHEDEGIILNGIYRRAMGGGEGVEMRVSYDDLMLLKATVRPKLKLPDGAIAIAFHLEKIKQINLFIIREYDPSKPTTIYARVGEPYGFQVSIDPAMFTLHGDLANDEIWGAHGPMIGNNTMSAIKITTRMETDWNIHALIKRVGSTFIIVENQ